MRQQYGFDVKWLTSHKIEEQYKMKSQPVILYAKGASIDAFQLAHGLFHNNYKRGMRIFDHTTVDNIKYEEGVGCN